MSFSTGSPRNSWQPIMTVDTATPSYWLNWRFLVCAACVVVSMVSALIIISKYDGPQNSKQESREGGEEPAGLLYEDEVWKPCLKGIHPAWLLAFRVLAFFVLLVLLILNVAVDGGDIYYYYTQWTSTLITLYFGLGSLLSIYGCFQNHNKAGGEETLNEKTYDAEQGTYEKNPNASMGGKHSRSNQTRQVRQTAGFWGYIFQIIFQMNAGAVMLTDCVFWLLIVPFLEIKEDYDLNFLIITMHTINAVFLLVDTALNCLRFPWFRIAYFFLWTAIYVVFQWIIHACFSLWWPYPFLDLSSPFAPLWYSLVGLMHIPCFGIFVLVMKIKHSLLSKWFPKSYQCVR